MESASKDLFLEIGKVVKAHGVRGKLKVKTYAGERGGLASAGSIFFPEECLMDRYPAHKREGGFVRFPIERSQESRGGAILALEGVGSMEEAESFVGEKAYLLKSDLPGTEEDEYYCFELIGFKVEREGGTYVGTLSRILSSPAHDLLEIETPSGEKLVPFIKAFVPFIDREARTIVISPVEGLLDDEI